MKNTVKNNPAVQIKAHSPNIGLCLPCTPAFDFEVVVGDVPGIVGDTNLVFTASHKRHAVGKVIVAPACV